MEQLFEPRRMVTKNIVGLISCTIFSFLLVAGAIAGLYVVVAMHDGRAMESAIIWALVVTAVIVVSFVGVLAGVIGLTYPPRKLAAIGLAGNVCLLLWAFNSSF